MHIEHDNISIWYGTPDAPAPVQSIPAWVSVPIVIGVRPIDMNNHLEVRFQVNQGLSETITARWMRNDIDNKSQYFKAIFPAFRAGDLVEYGVVCYCAGSMVPSEEEATRLPVSLRVGDGEARSLSDSQPLPESNAIHPPLSLEEAPVVLPTFTPILPETPDVPAAEATPSVIPSNIAETKAPDIPRPVPPPLPTIPLNELTGVIPNLSPELLSTLKSNNIHSLADIRSMGGLRHNDGLKAIKDRTATARLESHAQLSLLSPDTAIREKLIERGFDNLFTIARSGRAEFVENNHDVLGDFGAARLHAKARAQAAVATNAIIEAKVNAANGWTVKAEKPVVTASPLIGTGQPGITCRECKDCESAVSPLAYLADLIMYVKTNLFRKVKKEFEPVFEPVDYTFIEDTFHQKFGSLPISCELMDARLRQVRIAIEVLRKHRNSTLSTSATTSEAERRVLWDIYHTLLMKIGTTYAELRLAQTASQEEKEELAEKLGLSKPTVTEDHMKDLLLEKAVLNTSAPLEQRLEELFGFASTQKDPLEARPTPQLLEWRRKHLREIWTEQDWPNDLPGEEDHRLPLIDPDLIGPDDFRSPDATDQGFALWILRRDWIDGQLLNFKSQVKSTSNSPDIEKMLDFMSSGGGYPSTTSPIAIAKWTVTDPKYATPKQELFVHYQELSSGQLSKQQVRDLLTQLDEKFGLAVDGLNRLISIREKDIASSDPRNPKVEDEEWNDVYAILTQALKRLLFAKWLEEEENRRIEFGPNEFWISLKEPVEGEWPPTHPATDPWIDLELLKVTDLPDSAVGETARAIYNRRKGELEEFHRGLQEIRTDPNKGFEKMLQVALGNPLPVDLDTTLSDLVNTLTTAEAEKEINSKLYMTAEEFQRLMTIRAKENQTVTAQKPTAAEYEELYNLLTSAHKRRVKYPVWQAEETNAGMKYWQAFKARLPRWRASAEARADWQQKLRLRMRPAIIDPDLIAQLYLRQPFGENAAWPIWSNRYEDIQAKLALLRSQMRSQREGAAVPVLGISRPAIPLSILRETIPSLTTQEKDLDTILRSVVGISKVDLDQINKDRDEGTDITARLAQLNLSNEGFNYLIRVSDLAGSNATIEEEEWDTVYSILTQVWKERNIVKWHEEEKAKSIILGPDRFRLPEADQRLNLPELPDWRAAFVSRLDWEDQLQARIDQDQALEDSLRAGVDATEEVTLPALREVLIKEAPAPITGSLESRAKQLSDRFLIEMRDNGCAKTTRIAQAIETLQNLLFSIRTGQLRDTYPNLSLTDEALATFDEDWVWMGTYSAWRAAIFVLIYPENILLPSLRKEQTPAFRDLVKGLRTVGRVTPERARLAAQKYSEYFRDVCNLELEATATAEVNLMNDEGIAEKRSRFFLFARSITSDKTYWCTREGQDKAETQTFWHEVPGLSRAGKLIGAVEYKITEAERYIYLFAQVHDGRNYKLVFCRYDLVHPHWLEEQNELELPNKATSFIEARLLLQTKSDKTSDYDPSRPPRLEITLQEDQIFTGSLEEMGKGWEDKGLLPTKITFAEWQPVNQGVKLKSALDFLPFDAAEWIKIAHSFARKNIKINGKPAIAGLPTFHQTAVNHWGIIALTEEAAEVREVPASDWTSSAGREVKKLGPDFTFEDFALRSLAANDIAKKNKFAFGYPSFDDAGNQYGIVLVKDNGLHRTESLTLNNLNQQELKNEEEKLKEWASVNQVQDIYNKWNLVRDVVGGVAGDVVGGVVGDPRKLGNKIAFQITNRFVAATNRATDRWRGEYVGMPVFRRNGLDVFLLRTETKMQRGPYVRATPPNGWQLHYEYRQYGITPPRPDPDHVKIKVTYESNYNKHAPQSILTYLDEAWYFVPIQIALQLQRSGYYIEALDWFRIVYEYTADKDLRKIFYGLVKEEKSSKDYDRNEDWLRDPLDPHGIAASRYNVYTRFTLLSLIRCLLDYADAEFTRDTSESLPLARTLYKTALELLNAEELRQSVDGCEQIIGELKITYGDAIIKEIGVEEITKVDTLEKIFSRLTSIMDSSASKAKKLELARAIVEDTLAIEDSSTMTIQGAIEEGEKQRRDMAVAIMSMPGVVDGMNVFATNVASGFDSAMVALTGEPMSKIENMSHPFLRTLAPKPTVSETSFRPGATAFMASVGSIGAGPMGLTPSDNNPPGVDIPSDPRLDTIPFRERPINSRIELGSVIASNGSVTNSSTTKSLAPFSTIPELVFPGCIPPNPILKALRMKAELNLMKSWTCRNIAGVRRELEPYAAPTDTSSGMPVVGAGGQLVLPGLGTYRPTPYRYSILIERAKQLVQLSQQLESSLLAALQQRDAEAYNQLKARQDLETARANVTLQNLRKTEADAGVTLASLQRDRASLQFNHYQGLISRDINGEERAALALMWSTASLYTIAAATSEKLSQGISAAAQATSTVASALSTIASYERRKEEWEFQKLLASQDIQIGNQQIQIANDHVEVVKQEFEIAELQTQHAERGAEFLANKFTNTELYEWMAGVLEGVYRYFLQQATSMAKLASDQLAFERQETPPAFIQSDYWEPPNEDNLGAGQGRGPERHGLTGSARLLQDIYQLDQYAFETNKRKLQLSKTISLAALAPVEFQQFRETGVMSFATPMEMFDRDFPGHYLRLIRRVKTSVIALIPPGLGIKATLTASRSTRVVIGGDIFQTVRVQHGPDVVALTSPRDATGLFEMDFQPEMQAPFENVGVDAFWEFRMPKASNLFDFNSIADVLLTMEYTALNSFDYREQVIQNMRPKVSADRAFSFRIDFADEWYDLHNPELEAEENQMVAVFETGRQDFPPNLQSLKIQQVVLYFARKDGATFEIPVTSLRFTEQGSSGGIGGAANSIDGVISTRRGNASSWMSMIGKSPFGRWVLTLPNTAEIKNRFRNEEIEDILFVITYSGRTPEWPS